MYRFSCSNFQIMPIASKCLCCCEIEVEQKKEENNSYIVQHPVFNFAVKLQR